MKLDPPVEITVSGNIGEQLLRPSHSTIKLDQHVEAAADDLAAVRVTEPPVAKEEGSLAKPTADTTPDDLIGDIIMSKSEHIRQR